MSLRSTCIVVGALLREAVFALINFEHSSNLINSVSDIKRIFQLFAFPDLMKCALQTTIQSKKSTLR